MKRITHNVSTAPLALSAVVINAQSILEHKSMEVNGDVGQVIATTFTDV